MGRAAHAYAQAHFGIDAMLDAMEAIFAPRRDTDTLMCGIAGHFGRPIGAAVRARMLDALRARGPDAQHIVAFDADGSVGDATLPAAAALVHARLSIIDPRPVADQPMGSDDGTLWLCYNGEVYGWQDEARAARGARREFRTRSDTEFILRALRGVWHRRAAARGCAACSRSRSSTFARGACISCATGSA